MKITRVDQQGANAITTAQSKFLDLNPVNYLIDVLKEHPRDEKKSIPIPTIFNIGENLVKRFYYYHFRLLVNTAHYSEDVKKGVGIATKYALFPLSFSRVGEAIQDILSYSLLGNVAKTIVFCTLQIFHLIPYFLLTSSAAGILTLYHTTPVALITCLAGTMLSINIFFIYKLVEIVDASRVTLEQKADEMIQAISLTRIISNTFRSVFNGIFGGIRFFFFDGGIRLLFVDEEEGS